jgi:hypothetical protein
MLLQKYKDVCVWNYEDLKRIPFHSVEHQIKLDMTIGHQCIIFNLYEFKICYQTRLGQIVVATLQNFIHKDTIDLENVQGNKKKEKGEFRGCQN